MIKRIRELKDGFAFVISDLQGNRSDFERVLTLYYYHRKIGECKYLIICGDLIHGYFGYQDESFYILNKLVQLSKEDTNIIYLMGNHELSHLMHWNLKKGAQHFTENFEEDLKVNRSFYWRFLNNLPFAVFTQGGLVINHSGASKALAGKANEKWDLFFKINSRSQWYKELDFEASFGIQEFQKNYWDPKFGLHTLDTAEGKILWEIFMNKNELQYGQEYETIVEGFLTTMAEIAPANILISGHLQALDGFKIVNHKHFRICTSYGASNEKLKKYLLLPTDQRFRSAHELLPFTRNLWN